MQLSEKTDFALKAFEASLAAGDDDAIERTSAALDATIPGEIPALARYLDGLLAAGLDPTRYAERLLLQHDWSAGRTFEVPAAHTRSGQPLVFSL